MVYDYDRRINSILDKLRKINTNNSKNIIKYYETHLKGDNFAKATQEKWLSRTYHLCLWMEKDFEKATRDDIMKLIEEHIVTNNSYSEDSKKIYKIALKKFYRWLKQLPDDEDPPETNWIKTRRNGGRKHVSPEDLITDNDIEKMVKIMGHPRDKAFLITLAESGCRIGEILTLQVKNLNFDDRGAFFLVDGKTGTRRIRVVNSTPYLHDWLNNHPDKNDPEAPLWVSRGTMTDVSKQFVRGELKETKYYNNVWSYNMTYTAARKLLQVAAQKAKIKKPINPHNFRHSRATALGAAGINQAIMNEVMGWKPGSTTSGVYMHLSGKQIDDALLPAMYGVKTEKKETDHPQMFPIKCISCGELNPHNSKRCKKCNNIIGVITKEDLQQNSMVVEMSKLLGSMVNQKGDLKQQLLDNLKKELLAELKPKRNKK